jgi:hypothetical protein
VTTFASARTRSETTRLADGGTTASGERTIEAVPADEPMLPLGGNAVNTPSVGQLPYTGLTLLLFAIPGLALCATGLGIRRLTRRSATNPSFGGRPNGLFAEVLGHKVAMGIGVPQP